MYYCINSSQQAYIQIAPLYGAVGNAVTHPVEAGHSFLDIDLGALASGLYKVRLYVDDQWVDAKNLLVE